VVNKTFMIKATKAEDIQELTPRLRQDDINEIEALGFNSLISLMDGYLISDECYSVFVDNHIIGMFGINITSHSIWFLGSDGCNDAKREWVKAGRYYINHFLELSPVLFNTVSTQNKLHIKWLKRMGAKFSAPYLFNNHYFQDFYIIKGE